MRNLQERARRQDVNHIWLVAVEILELRELYRIIGPDNLRILFFRVLRLETQRS